MSRRASSLNAFTGTGITREIDSKYDVIKTVSEVIDDVETLANAVDDGSFADAVSIVDMVVATGPEGSSVTWDGTTLTIPVGDTGTTGADLTIDSIDDNGNGTLTIHFSDGTDYTTPDLTGPTGATGAQGIQGIQGIQGTTGDTGADGVDGLTPQVIISYNSGTGDLEYSISYTTTSGDPAELVTEW